MQFLYSPLGTATQASFHNIVSERYSFTLPTIYVSELNVTRLGPLGYHQATPDCPLSRAPLDGQNLGGPEFCKKISSTLQSKAYFTIKWLLDTTQLRASFCKCEKRLSMVEETVHKRQAALAMCIWQLIMMFSMRN